MICNYPSSLLANYSSWFSMMLMRSLFFLTFLTANAQNSYNPKYSQVQNGLNLQIGTGLLGIEFITPDIVRIQYTKEKAFSGNGTIVCIERPEKKIPFQIKRTKRNLLLSSDSLIVQIDLQNYAIEYRNAKNKTLLLAERSTNPREGERVYTEKTSYDEKTKRTVKTADGEKEVMDVVRRDTTGYSWKYRNHFQWTDKEAIYGLGSHMEDYLNLRGKELFLTQHNLKVVIPVLNSTAGYGLLFDAGCGMRYKDNNDSSFVELEAARQIDYYFMKGSSMDKVVAQYRLLTGASPMMPRYMFGYIQSKERYKSSKELIDVVAEYRKRKVPLDVIVQDWSYWPQGWGYMKMDPKFYPSPANLADSIHAMNVKLMVSIWPILSKNPQADELQKKGMMLKFSVYDAFNPLARKCYWDYANNEFFKNGFDAWWCDCTEPVDADWKKMRNGYGWDSHEERWKNNMAGLSELLGEERSSLYSLYHSKGLYENQRSTSDKKRFVNLTRSGYAGQQRFSTIVWNGDTHASWKSFAQQIPSGLNFMATGLPYWTVDIGAFFVKRGSQWFWNGDFNQGVNDLGYREFYTRMFQYGVFLPIFRSHGTDTPREIWNFGKPGEPFYESLLKMIHLRYQLLPYTYSLAGKVTRDNYTISRLLAFDFPKDVKVLDIKDEFMFGPSILVCPVTSPMYYDKESLVLNGIVKKRDVYLPKGADWVDFWTGASYKGGQYIKADAPIDKIPLFVRQGSIVPIGPVIQYTGEIVGKELTIAIYPGKDAKFTLYEDEGDNYNYEQGASSTIELAWDDKKKILTVGKRQGAFAGMEQERLIRIILHEGTKKSEKVNVVRYSGEKLSSVF